ncbi:uncharacterized protein LOC123524762 isoform X3 [Mercenaria mercenaria]|uniref:uncharacterized protein LOC123524762 isoform X3 n=1 Tax=Mercenaria mercenaria TaxID=6596 RepID=UPI00234F2ACD|nr:uncharacterized protein LOC123524762 isoform X3 [Mercenaria mercenaria]
MSAREELLFFLLAFYIGNTDAVCAFDPCTLPAICNGKSCVLTDDCEMYCDCDENSTSPSCQNVTITTTLASVTEKGCPCVHGNCLYGHNNETNCECEVGWGGENCDILCTFPCPEGQRCEPLGIPGMTICVDIIPENRTTALTFSTTTEYSFNRTYNVCDSAYTLRPDSEKVCNGWPCIYGTCDMDGTSVWCSCDPGGTGQNCQYECCRRCLYGSCFYISEEDREICNCHANYSGPYCEIWDPPTTPAPPEEVTWHYWVVGACAVLLLILITLMVVVPYIMWRNRVILVMKVVHYFQGYEDDDDRQWDAFISYKSNKADEHFVVKTLFPKLEKEMGFKVNVHFRDFVPGEKARSSAIANNIISAVQSSRRTIMIITPSYVTSEFTKFEYQVAQQEMLKRKHRIIPILFDDISECKETMDPNLKVILDSVTYIEWPKDGNEKKLAKFWKRMELSLPKIKNRSVEADNTKSQTNGTVTMTKPEDINISLSNEKRKSKTDIQNTKIYTMIDENKLDPEEVYDTLNESEMQSKVIAKKADSNHNGHVNVLKVDV